MRHVVGLALAMSVVAAAPALADSSYAIRNIYSGQESTGTTLGTHSVTYSPGTSGSVGLTGGAAPVVTASGTIAAGTETFLRMEVSHRYVMSISSVSPSAGQALRQVFLTPYDPAAVIGHASGIFNMSGSANSDSEVSLSFSGNSGSDSFSANCDSGMYCSGMGPVTAGVDTPYSLTLHMQDFSYCLGLPECLILTASPASNVELTARAGVGFTTDSNGFSLGGSVYAMIDPTIALDPQFFTDNGLDPRDYSVQLLAAGVPEPAQWAMLIGGFASIGAVARRRRAGMPAVSA